MGSSSKAFVVENKGSVWADLGGYLCAGREAKPVTAQGAAQKLSTIAIPNTAAMGAVVICWLPS